MSAAATELLGNERYWQISHSLRSGTVDASCRASAPCTTAHRPLSRSLAGARSELSLRRRVAGPRRAVRTPRRSGDARRGRRGAIRLKSPRRPRRDDDPRAFHLSLAEGVDPPMQVLARRHQDNATDDPSARGASDAAVGDSVQPLAYGLALAVGRASSMSLARNSASATVKCRAGGCRPASGTDS